MRDRSVIMQNGETWTIRTFGDCVAIIDPTGRERHRSNGHQEMASHLAMLLAETPLASDSDRDASMRLAAAAFPFEQQTYGFQYDFDEHGEPPAVYVADRCGRGTRVAEVWEDPTCINGEWSRDPDNWRPGPIAMLLLDALNRKTPVDPDGEWLRWYEDYVTQVNETDP